jgi:hypothetical protein
LFRVAVKLLRRLSPLLAASALGCGGLPDAALEADTAAGTEKNPIVGGEESLDDSAVVMLRTPFAPLPGEPLCTGTLVAPRLVLTALRCVAPLSFGEFSCNSDGTIRPPDTGAGWFFQSVPGNVQVHLGPRAARTEPAAYGARIWSSGSVEACIDDIALVELDRDLGLQPAMLRLDRGIARGDMVSVVGFGDTGTSNYPFVRNRRDGVHVTAVGPDDATNGVSLIVPRTFQTDDGLCAGDVGGPALDTESGAVVGVYSYATRVVSCYATGQTHVFVKVAPYASIIRKACAAVGSEPLAETTGERPTLPSRSGCSVSAQAGTAGTGAAVCLLAGLSFSLRARRRERARAALRGTRSAAASPKLPLQA